ncbi:unnamed protein product [Mytilus edulis]|uniref:Uncharacterized protein n=1 Tax=Mytilus edulis TaxID=6550 RepID=A0A8S3VJI3_MYTED|nr:unnamed protein product [Mytilus edulis]
MSDNTLKWTVQKNDMYCFERQVKGKKTYIQYDPQPKHVVTIHRYYTSLKREKTYKKRVSWFENLPDRFSTLSHKAIIEYTAVCPRQGEPHSNSKNSSQEYVRTDPKIIDEVKDRIQQYCEITTQTGLYSCEIHLLSSIELRVTIVELRVIKVELRVTIVELRVTKVELRVTIVELRVTKVELRVTIVELRVKKVELRVKKVELRVKIVELRVTKVELRVTKVELRVTKVELRVTKVELRVTNVELRVTEVEVRVSKVELRVKKFELRVKKVELRVKIVELRVTKVELRKNGETKLFKFSV